jgi:hypothetical protein
VGIVIAPSAFLLCYLLAAAELSIGIVSWGARHLTDTKALRLVAASFVVFHGASAILELWAFVNGLSARILANVVLRVVAVTLFAYYRNRPMLVTMPSPAIRQRRDAWLRRSFGWRR